MSIRGSLSSSDYGDATISVAASTRSGLVWAEWVDSVAAFGSFCMSIWMDFNLASAPPVLVGASDNFPSVFTITDNEESGSGISIASMSLSSVWYTRTVECVGPHNGAFQTLRTGVNTTTSTSHSRFQENTSNPYSKIRFLSLAGAGGLPGGRIVNAAIVTGSYTDAQIDQMRAWTTQYWADTWPAPYSGFVKWSRRLSTNGTTGFGTGDVALSGVAVFSSTGDPAIIALGGPTTSISITAAV